MSLGVQLNRKHALKLCVKYCSLVKCFKHGDCANFLVIPGTAISLRSRRPGVQIPAVARDASLLQGIRTNSRSLSATYSMGTVVISRREGGICVKSITHFYLAQGLGISGAVSRRHCVTGITLSHFNLLNLYIYVKSSFPVYAAKASMEITSLL